MTPTLAKPDGSRGHADICMLLHVAFTAFAEKLDELGQPSSFWKRRRITAGKMVPQEFVGNWLYCFLSFELWNQDGKEAPEAG